MASIARKSLLVYLNGSLPGAGNVLSMLKPSRYNYRYILRFRRTQTLESGNILTISLTLSIFIDNGKILIAGDFLSSINTEICYWIMVININKWIRQKIKVALPVCAWDWCWVSCLATNIQFLGWSKRPLCVDNKTRNENWQESNIGVRLRYPYNKPQAFGNHIWLCNIHTYTCT